MKILLQRMVDSIRSSSLQTKLICLYFLIIIIPTMITLVYFSNYLYKTAVNDVIKRNLYMIETDQIQIQNNMEIMRSISQYVISDNDLLDYLEIEKPLTVDELLKFNSNTLNMLTRVMYNNPTIDRLNIFSDNEYVNELWPILFYENRIKNRKWYQEILNANGMERWVFEDHNEDLIERQYRMPQEDSIVSLLRELKIGEEQHLGIVQVSMTLKDFIPKMYNSIEEKTSITLILDDHQNVFFNPETNFFSENDLSIEKIKNYYSKLNRGEKSYIYFHFQNVPYLMVYSYIEPLNAYLVNIEVLQDYFQEVKFNRMVVVFVTFLLVIILSIISYKLLSHELGYLYVLMDKMQVVEKGNLDVKVSLQGPKEIRQLSSYFQHMVGKIKQLMIDAVKKEAATKDAELRALKTQIDAHFLYNTLENIKMMTEIEGKYEISDKLTSLGEMMRYNLNWKEDLVDICSEIKHIKNYINIMNLRTNNRLQLNISIPPELMTQEIPKMSLQPIVENAVKHGIYPKIHKEPGIIVIKAKAIQKVVEINIIDNGIGIHETVLNRLNSGSFDKSLSERLEKGHGLGLKNVQERIELIYGKEYGINITSEIGSFTKVSIKLPLRLRGDDSVQSINR